VSLYAQYDHFNTPLGADGTPYEFFEALRDEAVETDTPIGWSEVHGGFWVATGYEAMREIQKNADVFSSRGVNFPPLGLPDDRPLMLAGIDEPAHGKYRRLLQEPFSPSQALAMKDHLRKDTNYLMDRFIDEGRVDVVEALAQAVPGRLSAMIVGRPPEDGDIYRTWVHAIVMHHVDPEGSAKQLQDFEAHFAELLADRRSNPGDDVFSLVVKAEIDGERLTDDELKDFFIALLIGGIDNTVHLLGNMFWRLAWDKELRRRLVAKPDLLGTAVEEFMRMYGPAQAGRIANESITVAGVEIMAGQQVQMVHPIANRDPRQFEHPDVFIPERSPNRHFALGLGIHRCLGAHLVRTEAQIVTEEFLRRIPDFELDPDRSSKWSCGQVAGMTSVPIVFEAGGRKFQAN
jgi:cytochrome P450